MENHTEIWQTQVNGQIYESSFDELTQWIGEGSLLPADLVRRGNLRWIEARKVPTLVPFFNAKELGIEPPQIQASVTISDESAAQNFSETQNFTPEQIPPPENVSQNTYRHISQIPLEQPIDRTAASGERFCALHPESEAGFHCETCENFFCRECPKGYGGNVKICPMCGAMCKKIGEIDKKKETAARYDKAVGEGFGISDIAKSFAHPFRFTTSFFFGGLVFMIFTLGQSAGALGGIFSAFSALVCFLLTNMLAFGILANTIESFSQGKLDVNFMPNFEDFNLWDDVVHPFFLSIAAYVSSFAPFVLATFVGFYLIFSSMQAQVQKTPTATAPTENTLSASPYIVDTKKAADQSEEVKKLLESVKQQADEKRELTEKGIVAAENPVQQMPEISQTQNTGAPIGGADQTVRDNENRQPETIAGETEETKSAEFQQMFGGLFKQSVVLLLLIFAALLWGIFYFPAACAVAGYTRSFFATINPAIGLNTIKTFGADYVKILGVFILFLIASIFIGGFLAVILAPFALPGMGNLPAIALSSWATFYFTIVFSCVIGFALFKNSDKFKFYKG